MDQCRWTRRAGGRRRHVGPGRGCDLGIDCRLVPAPATAGRGSDLPSARRRPGTQAVGRPRGQRAYRPKAADGIAAVVDDDADPFPVPEPTVLRYTRRDVGRPVQSTRSRKPGWLPWTTAAIVAFALAGYALLRPDSDRHTRDAAPASATAPRPAAVPLPPAPVPAPAPVPVPAAAAPAQLEFVAERALGSDVTVVETLGGTLNVSKGAEGQCPNEVRLRGVAVPGLCDDVIVLQHRAVFSDRDIVVGFTRCRDENAPCGHPRVFWLELHAGEPPVLRRPPDGVWVGGGKTAVSASSDGVRVDLGLWNGAQRWATLDATGHVMVERVPEPPRRLGRTDCTVVVRSLEACAASRDCSSFASSAERIPAANWQRLSRMYHETTGLNSENFRTLCQRSCELHLTPSASFVRRYTCNGADPGQWPADDGASGL
jgi:hypothetical protein